MPMTGLKRGIDPTPLYFRLEAILRDLIRTGEYVVGARLPSERALASVYKISRVTVRHAIDILVQEGLLRRERGRRGGSLVLKRPRPSSTPGLGPLDRIASSAQVSGLTVLAFDVRQVDSNVRKLLHLLPNAKIRYIERVISTRAGPLAYVRNYVPMPLGAALRREELDRKFVKQLLQEAGADVTSVRDRIEPCLADSRVAALLKVAIGTPLLRVTRLFLDQRERCIYLTLLLTSSNFQTSVTLDAKRPPPGL